MTTKAWGGGYSSGDKEIRVIVEIGGVIVPVSVDCDDVPKRAAKAVAQAIRKMFNERPKRGSK